MKNIRWNHIIALVLCICAAFPGISSYAAGVPVQGTWGLSTLSVDYPVPYWISEISRVIFNGDGSGSIGSISNENSTLGNNMSTPVLIQNISDAAHADGSLNLIFDIPLYLSTFNERMVISDDGKLSLFDKVSNPGSLDQSILVTVDGSRTYSNADLSGVYYIIEYIYDSVGSDWPGHYIANSGVGHFDGNGNITDIMNTWNGDGVVLNSSNGTGAYAVNPDGSFTVGNASGYISGDGKLAVFSHPYVVSSWGSGVLMKKADREYSTPDIAGTWALSSFGDDSGTGYVQFGTMTCNNSGYCANSAKFQATDGSMGFDGGSTGKINIAADGSFGLSVHNNNTNGPAYAAALGNNGNTMLVNTSFETDALNWREMIVGVRCSNCYNLAGEKFPMITFNPNADGNGLNIYLSDVLGNMAAVKENSNASWMPSISVDQKKVLYSEGVRGSDYSVVVYDIASQVRSHPELTTVEPVYFDKDGDIVFIDSFDGAIKSVRQDGTNFRTLAAPVNPYRFTAFWMSPDRQLIAAVENRQAGPTYEQGNYERGVLLDIHGNRIGATDEYLGEWNNLSWKPGSDGFLFYYHTFDGQPEPVKTPHYLLFDPLTPDPNAAVTDLTGTYMDKNPAENIVFFSKAGNLVSLTHPEIYNRKTGALIASRPDIPTFSTARIGFDSTGDIYFADLNGTNFRRFVDSLSLNVATPVNGSVDCSPNPVDYGQAATCTITPAPGYYLGAISGCRIGGLIPGAGSYTTGLMSGNCTVSTTFSECPAIAFSPETLPDAANGTDYANNDVAITANGGALPYTYAITQGTLPIGMYFTQDGTSLYPQGWPETGGTFNFTVTATDAHGCTGSKAYSISIPGLPTLGGEPIDNNLLISVLDSGRIALYRYKDGSWQPQVYSGDSKGSRLYINGTAYSLGYYDGTAATLISSAKLGGNHIKSVWKAGDILVTLDLFYNSGDAYYSLRWTLENQGDSPLSDIRFFHGQDTYFNNSDTGAGFWDAANHTVGVQKHDGDQLIRMLLQAMTVPFGYASKSYGLVYDEVVADQLSNTLDTNEDTDNGYALEWRNPSMAPGDIWTISAYEKMADVNIGLVSVTAPTVTDCAAGTGCDLIYTLQNLTGGTVNVTLSALNDIADWGISIVSPPNPVQLAASASRQVIVRVTVPPGTVPDTVDHATLSAFDGTVTASDTANVRAVVLQCAPIPSGLAAWWPGNNNAYDVMSGVSGTLLNGAGFAPGFNRQAFSFDGIDDSLTLGMVNGIAQNETSPFTVSAWINTTSPTAYQVIAGNYMGEGGGIGNYSVYMTIRDGRIFFGLNERQLAESVVSAPITTGWHHVSGAYDGTNMSLYVDGVFTNGAVRGFSGSTANTRGWTIGNFSPQTTASHGFESSFNGRIDEVQLYNRGLSAEEIASIYGAGSAGLCPEQGSVQKVLILSADDMNGPVSQLMASGRLSVVDQMDIRSATPTLEQLNAYDAVLAYTNYPPSNPNAVGDVLADYVDAGGRVVLASYSMSSPWNISGRIMSSGYSPLRNSGTNGGVSGILVAEVPGDSIFSDIDLGSLTFFYNGNFAHPVLDDGATLLATDGAGNNMLARSLSGRVIAANIFPSAGSLFVGSNSPELYRLLANMLNGRQCLGSPAVLGVAPVNGSSHIAIPTSATARFCEYMDPATINGSSFTLTSSVSGAVSGSVGYNSGTAVFVPATSLPRSATYTATLTSEVLDLFGNPLPAPYSWNFTVLACPAIGVNPAALPDGTYGTAYSQTMTASGGTGPYVFSGSLPYGLSLDGGGHITGTPDSSGTSGSFTITATDSYGCSGSRTFTMTVSKRAITVTADAKSKTLDSPDPVLTYTVSGGSLAAGDTLTLVRLSGETAGDYPITVGSLSRSAHYTMIYNGANLTIRDAYKATVTVIGSGTISGLPADLAFPRTGKVVLSFKPAKGKKVLSVTVNGVNLGAVKSLTLKSLKKPPVIVVVFST